MLSGELVPALPESDAKQLKSHLKQVLSSISIQPIKNFDDMSPDSINRLAQRQHQLEIESPVKQPPSYFPFLFGNDVDSVDVATRVAMVRFYNSSNLLADFTKHTRTLRLYPRPIVTLQIHQLLKSRVKNSAFMEAFVNTQAVECFAEWSLVPNNLAYKHVQNGIFDPIVIGDKSKWYAHNFLPDEHILWSDGILGIVKNLQVCN